MDEMVIERIPNQEQVDELTLMLVAMMQEHSCVDEDDMRPLAHKLVRLGWNKSSNFPFAGLEQRVAKLERYAQGMSVQW